MSCAVCFDCEGRTEGLSFVGAIWNDMRLVQYMRLAGTVATWASAMRSRCLTT